MSNFDEQEISPVKEKLISINLGKILPGKDYLGKIPPFLPLTGVTKNYSMFVVADINNLSEYLGFSPWWPTVGSDGLEGGIIPANRGILLPNNPNIMYIQNPKVNIAVTSLVIPNEIFVPESLLNWINPNI